MRQTAYVVLKERIGKKSLSLGGTGTHPYNGVVMNEKLIVSTFRNCWNYFSKEVQKCFIKC